MRKFKHKAYFIGLHSLELMDKYSITKNGLHSGWRILPDKLLQARTYYQQNPSKKRLVKLINDDTRLYYGILGMVEERKKRALKLKSEGVIVANYNELGWSFRHIATTVFDFETKVYVGNKATCEMLKKRNDIYFLVHDFIRTGKVKLLTNLRLLDKELVNDINKFIKK